MRVRCSSGLDVESYSGHCYRCVMGRGCGDGARAEGHAVQGRAVKDVLAREEPRSREQYTLSETA